MKQIPKGVQFRKVNPQGVFQQYRDYVVTPIQTYSNDFSINDIIRIQFNIQDWYIDPFESFLEAEVKLLDETPFQFANSGNVPTPYSPTISSTPKFYMMDGPSTSLINDYRLEVNSKEVERIREYDQLGNLLVDLNMYPDVVDQKDFEGYYSIQGKRTVQHSDNIATFSKCTSQNFATSNGAQIIHINNSNSIFAAKNDCYYSNLGVPRANVNTQFGITGGGTANIGTGLCVSQAIQSTIIDNGQDYNYTGNKLPNADPLLNIVRATNVVGSTQYAHNGNMWGWGTFLGGLTLQNSNFGIFGEKTRDTQLVNMCQQSPKLDQIDGHNIFLTNLPVAKISQGTFVNDPVLMVNGTQSSRYTQSRAYMQIPLLSGIMGVLIPQNRWQLIPSQSLGQVSMEFRLNDKAFFSHDGSQPRWGVTKFQLKLRMYKFDKELQDQLRSKVQEGIQIQSQIFSMGPIYNIQANTSVTNNWQLNNGIFSIKQLFFWFLSQDSEQNWNCRKNFKYSQNISSIQLKVASDYIPQTPIVGNSGNIVRNSFNFDDNSVFLSELQQSLNILFDCKRHININKLNFAINERPYDPSLQSFYGFTALTAVMKQQIVDYGYSLYQEMRCRGKAIFSFNLEYDKKDDDTMTGLDTTRVRPIELIIKNDGPVNPRGSTMYVMYLSDFVVTYSGDGLVAEGAG